MSKVIKVPVPKIDITDPTFLARFEKARRKWHKKVRPLIEAARKSEQITECDLRIIVR